MVFVLLLLSQLLAPAAVSARFGDFAEGSGTDINLGRFSFTAEGRGTESIASGSMRHRYYNGSSVRGDVFCLLVVGNAALVGGTFTHSSSGAPVGPGEANFVINVQDNADPGEAADRYRLSLLPLDTYPCGFDPNQFLAFVPPIVKGDIEVVLSDFPV